MINSELHSHASVLATFLRWLVAALVLTCGYVSAFGAEASGSAHATAKTITMQILFPAGEDRINPIRGALLDELVTKAAAIRLEVSIVVGHSDTSEAGTDKARLQLSIRRAEAVKAYLTMRGVDARRIYTEGKGDRDPAARVVKENRRVEIEVIGTTP